MINQLPKRLAFPNFNIPIEFEQCNETEFFGKVSTTEYKVILSDKNLQFNKYLYLSFLFYTIARVCDLKVSETKFYTLGAFFLHVFERNSILNMMTRFRQPVYKQFSINIPIFTKVTVAQHYNTEVPLGTAIISECKIFIYALCDNKLKDVILIHELIELSNALYRLKLSHTEIQVIAEMLTYIIKNNKGFIT